MVLWWWFTMVKKHKFTFNNHKAISWEDSWKGWNPRLGSAEPTDRPLTLDPPFRTTGSRVTVPSDIGTWRDQGPSDIRYGHIEGCNWPVHHKGILNFRIPEVGRQAQKKKADKKKRLVSRWLVIDYLLSYTKTFMLPGSEFSIQKRHYYFQTNLL